MKNLRLFIICLFGLFALSALVTSCQHDKLMDEIDISPTNNNAPIENNGVFKFRDIQHFEAYYNQLNKLYDEDEAQFEKVRSANNGVETVYNKFLNQEFHDVNNMYDPFLADPIMMNIANEHYEFQIGEILLTIVSNELILISEVNDSRSQSTTRLLEKGSGFNHLEIPRGTYLVTDEKMEDILGPWGETEYNFSIEDFNDDRMPEDQCIDEEVTEGWDLRFSQHTHSITIGWPLFKTIRWQEGLFFRTKAYYSWGRTYEEAHCYSARKDLDTGNITINNAPTLVSDIRATRRHNSDCSIDSTESESGHCNNCTNQKNRVNTGGSHPHKTNDVNSQYRKTWYVNNVEFTMFASHVLEFSN